MSIYATIFDLDDNNHLPGECAVYEEIPKCAPGEWDAATLGGRYWRRVDKPCTCGNLPPLVYQGSHVNPSADGPRGGALLVCAIPDHCHPDARFNEDDDGKPVPFLRLFAVEDESTYQGRQPGEATLVLDLTQVTELRDTLTRWISTRSRAVATAVPEPERPTLSPLRWHYGDDARMWCYDCGAEVYGFKEGMICSGCGREEPEPEATAVPEEES